MEPQPTKPRTKLIASLLRTMGFVTAMGTLVLSAAGCRGSMTGPGGQADEQPSFTIADFVTGVSDGSNEATEHSGGAPSPNGGPTTSPTGSTTVNEGGTSQVNVTSPSNLSGVVVFVEGASGYYDLRFSSRRSVNITVRFSRSVPNPRATCVYAGIGTDGRIGPYVGIPVSVNGGGAEADDVSGRWVGPLNATAYSIYGNWDCSGSLEMNLSQSGANISGTMKVVSNGGRECENILLYMGTGSVSGNVESNNITLNATFRNGYSSWMFTGSYTSNSMSGSSSGSSDGIEYRGSWSASRR